VHKYILARYQTKVWELNKQERIGKILYSMLERMPRRFEKCTLKLGASLQVQINTENARNKGIYLSNEAIIDFNDYIQMELIEEIAMYMWQVKNRVGMKKYRELYVHHNRAKSSRVHVVQDPNLFQYLEQREIIYDILKLYDISEDDFSFETIKKTVNRLKLPLLNAS
jgi:hypothetical protein